MKDLLLTGYSQKYLYSLAVCFTSLPKEWNIIIIYSFLSPPLIIDGFICLLSSVFTANCFPCLHLPKLDCSIKDIIQGVQLKNECKRTSSLAALYFILVFSHTHTHTHSHTHTHIYIYIYTGCFTTLGHNCRR